MTRIRTDLLRAEASLDAHGELLSLFFHRRDSVGVPIRILACNHPFEAVAVSVLIRIIRPIRFQSLLGVAVAPDAGQRLTQEAIASPTNGDLRAGAR